MIIIYVKYNCKEGAAKAFLDVIKENKIDVLCRAEDGNFKYDYSFDAENPDALVLNEVWRDADALAAHAKTEHLTLLRGLKDEYVVSTDIEKYEGERIG